MSRPHCHVCGRFAYAARDGEGRIRRNLDGSVAEWRFSCVTMDYIDWAWEHA